MKLECDWKGEKKKTNEFKSKAPQFQSFEKSQQQQEWEKKKAERFKR